MAIGSRESWSRQNTPLSPSVIPLGMADDKIVVVLMTTGSPVSRVIWRKTKSQSRVRDQDQTLHEINRWSRRQLRRRCYHRLENTTVAIASRQTFRFTHGWKVIPKPIASLGPSSSANGNEGRLVTGTEQEVWTLSKANENGRMAGLQALRER